MALSPVKVTLRVELLAVIPIEGDLCAHCLLPGLVRVTFGIWNDPRSVSPANLVSRAVCLDCGEPQ